MAEQDVLVKQEQKLTPDLSGRKPGQPLFEYFRKRLPPDLPAEVYDEGLSCQGFARLIIDELGGPEEARAFWIEEETDPGSVDVEKSGHTYVVKNGSAPSSLAYNNKDRENQTVSYVLKHGIDNTGQLYSMPWDML